ncbi:hypothetical protein [Mycolicibacterium aubagnense]|uniref:Peptidase n=1 Tax=Mycolicibacterium aubagnense TaxID=319707 RepID=A0ABN5YL72_9MYCO|nr:hypothetical protein [Mycolicibacterium aubagnense]TLH64427.1 hypothetical protein C1S80_12130 [Mycolicibacterium aubagnense]BBX82158.1 hypothetical protein MAUB_00310 [Mycolicibacterium aubagnense]
MNTVIAHLQMTVMMTHGFALSPSHTTTDTHTGGGHSGGGFIEQIIHGAIRGFSWTGGSMIARSLGVGGVVVVFLIVGAIYLLRKRKSS